LLSAGALIADEAFQNVQRELRARKYYFGPVDGRESPEAKAAIEEFQRAKALDATGTIDEETLRALGLRPAEAESDESRALKLGREWLARYWHACESGDWALEQHFYAEKVRYYYEGEVTREYLRQQRTKYCALWPSRRQTALLSYASWNPRRHDELWVSARVRN
jgi:peptidoglycan hydrolase-like protein with peptidoglycan-binding domain